MKIVNSKPRSDIQAVIYDLDATLLDTEPNWFLADKRLMKDYGIEFTEEMKEKYIGIGIGDMVDDLRRVHGLTAPDEEIHGKKNNYYMEIALGTTEVFPSMKPFYDGVRERGYPTAIASGTAYNVISALLQDLDMIDHFEHVVSAEHVGQGKPAPDIYIETAKRLRINPENILVLEDSLHGVQSALAAGMNCVAIPYLYENGISEGYYDADIVFEQGMSEFNHQTVFDWMKA